MQRLNTQDEIKYQKVISACRIVCLKHVGELILYKQNENEKTK